MQPRAGATLFFYIGAAVGASWMAWQRAGDGPLAELAAIGRDIRHQLRPEAPIELALARSQVDGAAGGTLPAGTWWVPPPPGRMPRPLRAACEAGDTGALSVGTFARVHVRQAGVWLGDSKVMSLDEGRPPPDGARGDLLVPLATRTQAMLERRRHQVDDLPCVDMAPERVLLIVDGDIPLETHRAVAHTLWLVGASVEHPRVTGNRMVPLDAEVARAPCALGESSR